MNELEGEKYFTNKWNLSHKYLCLLIHYQRNCLDHGVWRNPFPSPTRDSLQKLSPPSIPQEPWSKQEIPTQTPGRPQEEPTWAVLAAEEGLTPHNTPGPCRWEEYTPELVCHLSIPQGWGLSPWAASYPYSSPSVQSTPPFSAQKERFHRSCLCHPEAQQGGQGTVQERERE